MARAQHNAVEGGSNVSRQRLNNKEAAGQLWKNKKMENKKLEGNKTRNTRQYN